LPGGVKWYRFDEKGTYEFRVDGPFAVEFAVYLDSDLSRPRQQYREEFSPDYGKRFVLPSAPFLVKVFCPNRDTEFNFTFRAHRHLGASIPEAIDIVPEQKYFEQFPASQILNLDTAEPPWNDTDSKWFRLDPPRVAVGGPIELRIEVALGDHAETGAMIFAGRLESGGNLTLVAQAGPDSGPLAIAFSAKPGERFYIAVQRGDTGGTPLAFDIVAHTNVNLLLGGQVGTPRLVCNDETSGWGSDDIALSLEHDGKLLHDISNDEIGDFDQDDVRDLNQWIPDVVAYLDHIGITVIEEDDIDDDDVGHGRVPPVRMLSGAPGISIDRADPDGTWRVRLHVDVDDGAYEFRCSVTQWNERA
jgi:hypothetical protein